MRSMHRRERDKLEAARDQMLTKMGFELVHTNTIRVRLDGYSLGNRFFSSEDCLEIEIQATVYPDDKIMQVILQKVFDAGVKTGRLNLQTALNNLLTPDTED